MILPPRPWRIICLPARRLSRNGAVRFTSITACQSSSGKSSLGARRWIPAAFTSTSISPPSRSRALPKQSRISSVLARSQGRP